MAAEAIGAAGRQVQCATCASAWMATPSFPAGKAPLADPEPDADEIAHINDDDTLFDAADEELLDDAFVRADPGTAPRQRPRRRAGDKPKQPARQPAPDPGAEALARRKLDIARKLPLARIRRAGRVVLAVCVLAFVAIALLMRTDIVRAVPELDSVYRLVGLGTNVVGLDFTEIETLRTTRDGNAVLVVTARIGNVTPAIAQVPPVLVSLLGEDGAMIYEWSVNPAERSILPGDVIAIDTQLTNPPQGVERVRLRFLESGRENR